MTDLRQAAQQALGAWDDPAGMKDLCVAMDTFRAALEQQMLIQRDEAIIALRRALEQQAEPVAVHQWRKQGCANWYDGYPDYSDGDGPYETRTFYTAPLQQQAEPVMLNGLTESETNATASVMGLTKQAEPVAWDKPGASFNDWWDGDYDDAANPFKKDSAAYWAWAGWKAAQRQWQGLTDDDCARMSAGDKLVAMWAEAILKEKNT